MPVSITYSNKKLTVIVLTMIMLYNDKRNKFLYFQSGNEQSIGTRLSGI